MRITGEWLCEDNNDCSGDVQVDDRVIINASFRFDIEIILFSLIGLVIVGIDHYVFNQYLWTYDRFSSVSATLMCSGVAERSDRPTSRRHGGERKQFQIGLAKAASPFESENLMQTPRNSSSRRRSRAKKIPD
jgi:hypothetical protein